MSRANHNLALDLLLPVPPTHVDSFETLQNPRNRIAFPAKEEAAISLESTIIDREESKTHQSESEQIAAQYRSVALR